VKLATIEKNGSPVFVLAPAKTSLFLPWTELVQKEFSRDKLFQRVQSLTDFISLSSSLVPALLKSEKTWGAMATLKEEDLTFVKAFAPLQFRDFYCFEEHVKKGRKSRGLDMIPEWYEKPVFYYSNALNFRGPGPVPYPRGSEALDFELEIGCVVGKELYNASLEEAEEAILAYCLLNDFSARDFQKWEMKLNMGPTKGKDFCSSFGPYLVTKDELESFKTTKGYDLEFRVVWNDQEIGRSNWSSIGFSFAEMLVRASANCRVFPGEILGSGTMGTGCLMEWNIDRELPKWLKPGDRVQLECPTLGWSLSNQIVEEN
jgi:2-keto-4-pentenoate hydratase/2-oxohepta-3-ene-1,7-dioic acid hydratase in catechol pathway